MPRSWLLPLIRGAAVGLVAAAACALLPPQAAAQCPQDTLYCKDDRIFSTDPSGTLTCSDGFGSGSASYDLVSGWFSASSSAGDINARAAAHTSDLYRVTGLAPGTSVSFFAELHVDAYAWPQNYCGGFDSGASVFASLALEQGASVSFGHWGFCLSFPPCTCSSFGPPDSILRIPVTRVAGSPGEEFRLQIRLSSGATWGQAFGSAQLAFSGLPPGSSVISCQGYRQDFPVPALSASWGSLKARYR